MLIYWCLEVYINKKIKDSRWDIFFKVCGSNSTLHNRRHPFTREDPLLSKWCKHLSFSKFFSMKKQTHLHLGWPKGEYIFSKFLFLGKLLHLAIILVNNVFHHVRPKSMPVISNELPIKGRYGNVFIVLWNQTYAILAIQNHIHKKVIFHLRINSFFSGKCWLTLAVINCNNCSDTARATLSVFQAYL